MYGVFALISIYVFGEGVFLSYLAFADVFSKTDSAAEVGKAFLESTNAVLLASVLAVFGIFIWAGLLYWCVKRSGKSTSPTDYSAGRSSTS